MLQLPAPTTDTPTLDELDVALSALRSDTSPTWGTMNAVQMVRHCTKFVDLYRGNVPVPGLMRFAARMVGPMFLRRLIRSSPTKTPRNLRTLPSIRAAADLDAALDNEAAALRAGLDAIAALQGSVEHPLYGPTEAETCRTLVRHHTAHHFHQFGLLAASPAGTI